MGRAVPALANGENEPFRRQVGYTGATMSDSHTKDISSLLNRAAAGETGAFGELARQHEERLFRQALGLCRDEHVAEDLTQETLLEAWRSLARYNGACRFSTWLYAILPHRHQKSLRKGWRFWRATQDTRVAAPVLNVQSDPAEAAARKEAAERLRAAVEALPPNAREVIRLRFFADAALDEIAVALNIPLGTAKSRLHYALERLRQTHGTRLNPSEGGGDSLSEGESDGV